MARRLIALDIGPSHIRLLQVRQQRVERWASAEVERVAEMDGAIPSDLGGQVRRLMRSSGINGGDLFVSLSGRYSVARVVRIPPPPLQETLRSLPELAQRTVPSDDLDLRWHVMSSDETGQEVLIMGTPSAAVEAQVAALRSTGLRPVALELRAMALVRLVNRDRAIIVNAEPWSVDMVVVSRGIPHVMRTVPLYAGSSPEEVTDQVAAAVDRTVAFFNDRQASSPLPPETPLFLLGSLTENPALREKVEAEVGYPLADLEPAVECPPHLPLASYAVALGLVLRGTSDNGGSQSGAKPLYINFLPPSASGWRLTPQRALAILVVLAGLAVANLLYGQVAQANQEVASVDRQLFQVEQQVKLRRAELNLIGELEVKISDIQKITAPWGRTTAALALVEKLRTPGVTIKDYTIDQKETRITADAETVDQAFDFADVLRCKGVVPVPCTPWEVPYPGPSIEVSATFKGDILTTPK